MDWLLLIIVSAGIAAAVVAVRARRRASEMEQRALEAEQNYREVIGFLNQFARNLATVKEAHHALELVAQYVRELLKAESVGIFLASRDAQTGERYLQGAASAGSFPPLHPVPTIVQAKARYLREYFLQERLPFGRGIAGRVADTQRSILIEDARSLPDLQLPPDVRTCIAAPMLIENRLYGVICAVNRTIDASYTVEDLRLLENLACQAALASNLVTTYEERSQQERLHQELEFARELQQAVLPAEAPAWGDCKIRATARSAREVGGDFYDFVRIDDDRLMIVVGDATGKGIPACMLMAMCQSFVRACVQQYRDLPSFLRMLNRFLFQDTDRAHFVTMGVVVIDRRDYVCDYGRAGHTPLLVRIPEGATRTIHPRGAAVGLLPEKANPRFDTISFSFRPGMSLLLFTDGITEALNEKGEEYGLERLERVWAVHSAKPETVPDILLQETRVFAGAVPQADDQTVVVVSRPPSSD